MSILLTSLWLGILTSISPCPLTTNIAAVSFVGKRIDKPFYVLLSGLVYSFGRALLYLVLGLSISRSLQMIPYVSDFLQSKISSLKYDLERIMNQPNKTELINKSFNMKSAVFRDITEKPLRTPSITTHQSQPWGC